MEFTVAAQASNKRVTQFKLATIDGSGLEVEAVMQEFARTSVNSKVRTRRSVQDSTSFVELVISEHLVLKSIIPHPYDHQTTVALLKVPFSVVFIARAL